MEKRIYYKTNSKFFLSLNTTSTILDHLQTLISDKSFWALDKFNNQLIINKSSNVIESDIFEQFYAIIEWLYLNKCYLSGSISYRVDNMIESISANSKLIVHYIIPDIRIISSDSNIDQIVEEDEIKIKRQIEQNNMQQRPLHLRMASVEKKLNYLAKENKFLWKMWTFLGICTTGLILIRCR